MNLKSIFTLLLLTISPMAYTGPFDWFYKNKYPIMTGVAVGTVAGVYLLQGNDTENTELVSREVSNNSPTQNIPTLENTEEIPKYVYSDEKAQMILNASLRKRATREELEELDYALQHETELPAARLSSTHDPKLKSALRKPQIFPAIEDDEDDNYDTTMRELQDAIKQDVRSAIHISVAKRKYTNYNVKPGNLFVFAQKYKDLCNEHDLWDLYKDNHLIADSSKHISAERRIDLGCALLGKLEKQKA